MKISTTNRTPIYGALLMIAFAFVFALPSPAIAQSLSDFDQAVQQEASSFNSIAKTIINIILTLGAIGVIYAYVTKRQDAKDYLIYYLIGVVVLGVLRTTVLK